MIIRKKVMTVQSKKLFIDGREYTVFEDGRIIGPSGKELTQFINNDGYAYICTKNGGAYVHRLVAMAFIPNPEGYSEVDHIDGNRRNNHRKNLEWVTRKENVIRAAARGAYRGEKNGSSKLNKYEVLFIKAAHSYGVSPYKISALFPVSRETVRDIVNGKNWKHVSFN